jgi:hypothetical protein
MDKKKIAVEDSRPWIQTMEIENKFPVTIKNTRNLSQITFVLTENA